MTNFKIVRGIKTNRVRHVRGKPRVVVDPSAQRAKLRFRADPEVWKQGKLYTTICISLPVEDLLEIDRRADEAEMSRSHFLRSAALAFVKPPNKT